MGGLIFPACIVIAKAMATGAKARLPCLGRITEENAGRPLHPLSRRTVEPALDSQAPVAAIADMASDDQPAQIVIIDGVVTDHATYPAAIRSRDAASRPISARLRATPQA